MNAIRIRRRVDAEMLRSLPELRELNGKEVEIIVLDEAPVPAEKTTEPTTPPDTASYDKFFELAGKIDLDWGAYKAQRAFDLEQ